MTPPPKTLAGEVAQGFRALGASETMVTAVIAEAVSQPSLGAWYARSEQPEVVVWLAARLVLDGPPSGELSGRLERALCALAELREAGAALLGRQGGADTACASAIAIADGARRSAHAGGVLSGHSAAARRTTQLFTEALPWTALAVRWRAAVCSAFCASCGRASEHLAQVPAASLAEQLCAACATRTAPQEGPR